jgi:hypothetical protein
MVHVMYVCMMLVCLAGITHVCEYASWPCHCQALAACACDTNINQFEQQRSSVTLRAALPAALQQDFLVL